MRCGRTRQPARSRRRSDFERDYASFLSGDSRGDLVFAPDAVLHVPGRSRVAGTFAGVEKIDAYFRSLGELSDDSVRIELEDVSERGPDLVAWQHLTASRNGRALSDRQCVRFSMANGRVKEAWIYPSDLQEHDEFWGGARRPVFTPEDRAILASAFRESRPQASSTSGVLALILAMVGASLAITGYNVLHDWRPPVAATVTTQSVTTLRHLTMRGGPGSVRWSLEGGYVRELAVSGATDGTAVVLLPLPDTRCDRLADDLDGECVDGEVRIARTPVELTWSSPQYVSSGGARVEGRSLDIAPFGSLPDPIGVALFTRTRSTPSLCFSAPGPGVTLEVSRGDLTSLVEFTGEEAVTRCEGSLHLVIGSGEGGVPPTFELRSVDGLTLKAYGARADLEGLSGQIVLSPGDATAFSSPAVLTLEADPSDPFAATLKLETGQQSLFMHSVTTTSALTETGELVPSEWIATRESSSRCWEVSSGCSW